MNPVPSQSLAGAVATFRDAIWVALRNRSESEYRAIERAEDEPGVERDEFEFLELVSHRASVCAAAESLATQLHIARLPALAERFDAFALRLVTGSGFECNFDEESSLLLAALIPIVGRDAVRIDIWDGTPPACFESDSTQRPTACEPSPDFRRVKTPAGEFTFTRRQAKVVEALWADWIAGGSGLPDDRLLIAADSEQTRLDHIFRNRVPESRKLVMHPAWGRLIVKTGDAGKPSRRLSLPTHGQA